MGKDNEKKLVGQPIFKQVIDLLPRDKFEVLVHKFSSYQRKTESYSRIIQIGTTNN